MEPAPGVHGERQVARLTLFHERRAGRAVILDQHDRVLMIRGLDPDDPERGRFLWTPGGGIDDHESFEEGTRRELWEEVGLDTDDLGSVVLTRTGEFPFGGRLIRQSELYYYVRAPPGFEPTPHHRSELEERAILEIDWFTIDDLRASPDPYYPFCLTDLIGHLLIHDRPAKPWTEEQRLPRS